MPTWGDAYHLGDLPDCFKAPKINKSFSLPLDRPVSTSHYVSLSLEETAKLETCLREMIKSQSFSIWALASVFAFLKDPGCVPEEDIFHQLITSLMVSLNFLKGNPFYTRSGGAERRQLYSVHARVNEEYWFGWNGVRQVLPHLCPLPF